MALIKKNLGQNFLRDKNKVNQIVSVLPDFSNSTVLEVGPGEGALTKELIKKSKKLIAIEIDKDMVDILSKINDSNFKLIYGDILNLDLNELTKDEKECHFVSNLPYYISTKIMFIVALEPKFKTVSVMLQKELVDRIFAQPGNKTFGRLTVSINSLFDLKERIKVSRGSFIPVPNVDSGFIVLKRKDIDFEIIEYLEFVKAVFGLKRKTLINSLKQYAPSTVSKTRKWLAINELKENIRAEQIEATAYIDLYKYIYN